MNRFPLFFFAFILFVSVLHAEPQITNRINFSGGYNSSQIAINIKEEQSPDMLNMISDPIGTSSVRKGTSRVFSQAVSSYPINSCYFIHSETSTEKALFFTNKNSVYYTTGGFNPQVVLTTNTLGEYDGFQWLQMDNKAILLGGHDNDIKEFDPITKKAANLFGNVQQSTSVVFIRAKHGIVSKNYLILANVKVSSSPNFDTNISTIFPSRIYFSALNKRSSFTAFNYIDFASGDGQEITGVGSLYGSINFFKGSKILEMSFSILDFTPSGDITTREIVEDFGLRAPRSLVNTRLYYALAADDGIRIWNGSQASRLTTDPESRVISGNISNVIEKLIRTGTYSKSLMLYYPKREWLIFAYEDIARMPRGANNSILVYDFKIGEWFPLAGFNPQSAVVLTERSSNGELVFGDNDGYLFNFDLNTDNNDMRLEFSVDPMEDANSWDGASQDFVNVKTGTASLSMDITNLVTHASMTRINTFNFGEWPNGTRVTRNDKFTFKAYIDGLQNISSLRVDLEVKDVASAFDANFTSVTFSSASFTGGNNGWTEFSVPLSSFPIRQDWVSLDLETLPFANTLFFYGIRFVLDGVNVSTVSIDDVRIVSKNDEVPISYYRFSKLFDFGVAAEKNMGSCLLTMDKPVTSDLSIDIYNNFGSRIRTENLPLEFPKELGVIGYSTGTIAILDSNSFDVLKSSTISEEKFQFLQGVSNKKNIFLADRDNGRILKMDRDSLGGLGNLGSFGTGSTNYSLIHQSALNRKSIFSVDMVNQKIKQRDIETGNFIRDVGGLGTSTNTLKFHQPTGIAANDSNVFVADEGNYRWLKLNISTLGFNTQFAIDYNTIGETTFALDDKHIYAAYLSGVPGDFNSKNIVLEKRDINNFDLLQKIIVYPKNSTANRPYGHTGDIAIVGDFLYILFYDDENNLNNCNFYLQKRLKSDFSLVKEKIYPNQRMLSLFGNGVSYDPSLQTKLINTKIDGRYIQLKFYGNSIDNNIALHNISFLLEPKTQGY